MKKNDFNRIEQLHERIQEMLLSQLPADLGHTASIGFRVPYGPAHFYVPLIIELTPDNAEDAFPVSSLQRGLSVPPMNCYDVTVEMNGAGTFLKFYIKIPNQLQEDMKVTVDE